VRDGSINEKRLYTRVQGNLSVNVYYNDRLIATCPCIDLSIGGIALESVDLGLSVNSLVEIKFDVDDSYQLYDVIFPAIVKRVGDGKIALSFEMLEKATEQIIQQELVAQIKNN